MVMLWWCDSATDRHGWRLQSRSAPGDQLLCCPGLWTSNRPTDVWSLWRRQYQLLPGYNKRVEKRCFYCRHRSVWK